jgi:hypothetical protein
MSARLTMRDTVNLSATVNLLWFAREIGIDWKRLDTIVSRLERLRYVDYVEDRHQFWIRLELDTSSPETARKRIEATLAKVERLLRSYVK